MNVFLGCPTHDGRIESGTATGLRQASQKHTIIQMVNRSSLLAYNCNQLWCAALNMLDQYQLRWFAMLHSDVVPESNWLDKMIDIAEENNVDLLSAVVPIKDESRTVSMAIGTEDPFKSRRMHITEVCIQNISAESLRVNTGCMICRIDRPWSDKLFFQISDRITLEKGSWMAEVEPEDWFFSRQVEAYGGVVMATQKIELTHVGTKHYRL